jgi:hypothetical protein
MVGVCMRLFYLCVVLCLGSGLAKGWSLAQESYRQWKMITDLNKTPGPWMGWKGHWKKWRLSTAQIKNSEWEWSIGCLSTTPVVALGKRTKRPVKTSDLVTEYRSREQSNLKDSRLPFIAILDMFIYLSSWPDSSLVFPYLQKFLSFYL